jgi:hypothetical protein
MGSDYENSDGSDEFENEPDLDVSEDEGEATLESTIVKKNGHKVVEPGMEGDDDEDDEEDNEDEDDVAETEAAELDEATKGIESISFIDANTPEARAVLAATELTLDANHKRVIWIDDDKRMTSDVLQYTEMVAAINYRIAQIEAGAPYFIEATGVQTGIELTTAAQIAKAELLARRSPLILRRDIWEHKDGRIFAERWFVNEMIFVDIV